MPTFSLPRDLCNKYNITSSKDLRKLLALKVDPKPDTYEWPIKEYKKHIDGLCYISHILLSFLATVIQLKEHCLFDVEEVEREIGALSEFSMAIDNIKMKNFAKVLFNPDFSLSVFKNDFNKNAKMSAEIYEIIREAVVFRSGQLDALSATPFKQISKVLRNSKVPSKVLLADMGKGRLN